MPSDAGVSVLAAYIGACRRGAGAAAGAGMSLVRVTAVGICGSDLHWWGEGAIGDAGLAHPVVLGHEGAGVIAAGPRRGERVAIDPAIPCETCRACQDGYRNPG
jgi:L-iditol 2-dehydrogenase